MLEVKQIPFIEDEVELKSFLNDLFKLVAAYHKEVGSDNLDFATTIFIEGWKDNSITVFLLHKDGKKEPVGFALGFVGVNLLTNQSTLSLAHAYIDPSLRGDLQVLDSAIKQLAGRTDELKINQCFLNVSPELMPLIMKLTDGKLLYSVIGI